MEKGDNIELDCHGQKHITDGGRIFTSPACFWKEPEIPILTGYVSPSMMEKLPDVTLREILEDHIK